MDELCLCFPFDPSVAIELLAKIVAVAVAVAHHDNYRVTCSLTIMDRSADRWQRHNAIVTVKIFVEQTAVAIQIYALCRFKDMCAHGMLVLSAETYSAPSQPDFTKGVELHIFNSLQVHYKIFTFN